MRGGGSGGGFSVVSSRPRTAPNSFIRNTFALSNFSGSFSRSLMLANSAKAHSVVKGENTSSSMHEVITGGKLESAKRVKEDMDVRGKRTMTALKALVLFGKSAGDMETFKSRVVAALAQAETLFDLAFAGSIKTVSKEGDMEDMWNRVALSKDHTVRACLDRFWSLLFKETDGTIHREEYIMFARRVIAVLLPDIVDPQRQTLAEEMFENDAAGRNGVEFAMFQMSLFELADLVVPTKERVPFVEFLTDLYARTTRRSPREGWTPEGEILPMGSEWGLLNAASQQMTRKPGDTSRVSGDPEAAAGPGTASAGISEQSARTRMTPQSVENALRLFDTIKRMKYPTAKEGLAPADTPIIVDVASSLMGGKVIDCSSVFSAQFQGRNVINGIEEDGPGGAWAALEGIGASITISFSGEYLIDALVFQQRQARMTHVAEVKLTFSNGTSQWVQLRSGAGGKLETYKIEPVKTSQVRLEVVRMMADNENANAGAITIQYLTSMLPRTAQLIRDRVKSASMNAAASAAASSSRATTPRPGTAQSTTPSRASTPMVPMLNLSAVGKHNAQQQRTGSARGASASSYANRLGSSSGGSRGPLFTPRALTARETKWFKPRQAHDLNVLENVIMQRMKIAEEWNDEDTQPTSCFVDMVNSGLIPMNVVAQVMEDGGRGEEAREMLSRPASSASRAASRLSYRPATSASVTRRSQGGTPTPGQHPVPPGGVPTAGFCSAHLLGHSGKLMTGRGGRNRMMMSKSMTNLSSRPLSAYSNVGDFLDNASVYRDDDLTGDFASAMGDHVHLDESIDGSTWDMRAESRNRVSFSRPGTSLTDYDRPGGPQSPRPQTSMSMGRGPPSPRGHSSGGNNNNQSPQYQPRRNITSALSMRSALVTPTERGFGTPRPESAAFHVDSGMYEFDPATVPSNTGRSIITVALETERALRSREQRAPSPPPTAQSVSSRAIASFTAPSSESKDAPPPAAKAEVVVKTAITSFLEAYQDHSLTSKIASEARKKEEDEEDRRGTVAPNLFTMGDEVMGREVSEILKEQGIKGDKYVTAELFCDERPRAISPRAYWRPDTPGGPFFSDSAHRLGDAPDDNWKRYRYPRPPIEDLRPQTARIVKTSANQAAGTLYQMVSVRPKTSDAYKDMVRPKWAPAKDFGAAPRAPLSPKAKR